MQLLRYLVSAAILFVCYFIGNQLQMALSIPIPGSIIGLLLLFSLLVTNIVPLHWVKPSASLLINYMMLLFVPVGVGLIVYTEILMNNWLLVLCSTVGGSLLVMLGLALSLQKILGEPK